MTVHVLVRVCGTRWPKAQPTPARPDPQLVKDHKSNARGFRVCCKMLQVMGPPQQLGGVARCGSGFQV